MLVTRKDIMFLKDLSMTTREVAIDTIPDAFLPDFQKFFFGKTLMKKDGTIFAYPHDLKKWVDYMFKKYRK